MKSIIRRTVALSVCAGFVLGLVFSMGLGVGLGWKHFNSENDRDLANDSDASDSQTELAGDFDTPERLQELLLRADSASGGKSMAMATGPIDEDIEGLFVLDFLTGELYCWVLSPRGGWQAEFRTNVVANFGGVDRDSSPEYIMTTGFVSPPGGRSGQVRPANTICYVGDANTGKVVAYSLEWDRGSASNGREQAGLLVPVADGQTRSSAIERD